VRFCLDCLVTADNAETQRTRSCAENLLEPDDSGGEVSVTTDTIGDASGKLLRPIEFDFVLVRPVNGRV
jgi:hypothetical protein